MATVRPVRAQSIGVLRGRRAGVRCRILVRFGGVDEAQIVLCWRIYRQLRRLVALNDVEIDKPALGSEYRVNGRQTRGETGGRL